MTFPWQEPDDTVVPVEAAGQLVPVAWWGRTSDEEQQDPTLSLPRQLRGCRDALPAPYGIVAHFYDVESGRMDLALRGQGRGHEAFNIPIARDGGIQDLLAEAQRPDRRFVAVICENIERIARRTYFGTKVEHELEQSGVMLLAADEPLPDLTPRPGGRAAKRATPILTRRVKQAVAEWYVLQLLEQSWDGTAEHTEQGWNIGKPCYGYRAHTVPHPVAARRAEGRTKHRLVPDPVEGPTVTRIFDLRAVQRLGYRSIADALNTDPVAHPPPMPPDPRRALGRWSGSSVREILNNPKYTGYMVWNRKATSSRKGKVNPPSQWVWSPRPTHEPLVTKESYQAVTEIGRANQGSRAGTGTNSHPKTKRSYELRSYVTCDLCGRRMHGKARGDTAYMICRPDIRQHAERTSWYDTHPKGLFVRQDDLLTLTHDFFTEHVFGPRRHDALRVPETPATKPDTSPAVARLEAEIADLAKRRRNILDQIEEYEPTGDDDLDRDCRADLRQRLADVAQRHKTKTGQLAGMSAPTTEARDDLTVLDQLPPTTIDLAAVPEDLRRGLYDSFNLELRYHGPERAVTIRVTVRQGRVPDIRAAIDRVGAGPPPGTTSDERSLVLGARGGVRTRTAREGQRGLSPLRLPVSPPGRGHVQVTRPPDEGVPAEATAVAGE